MGHLTLNEQKNNRRISVILREFMDNESDSRVTIGQLKDTLADRAFAILMLIFALPNLVPIPIPGISVFLGIPLILLSFQLASGRKAPWFPLWLSRKSISDKDLSKIFSYIMPYLVKLEKVLRPRFGFLVKPYAERIIAGLCFIMAILIALPIPLGNWFPAFSICLFSLAILEHDGVFCLLGIIAVCISLILVSSVVTAITFAALYFLEQIIF